MNKPEPIVINGVPYVSRECPYHEARWSGCSPAKCNHEKGESSCQYVCIPQIQIDEAELVQLRACHEAELGVCQQHCDIVQKSEQEIRRLERLVEKGVPPGPPDPPRPLVRKDFG